MSGTRIPMLWAGGQWRLQIGLRFTLMNAKSDMAERSGHQAVSC